MPSAEQGLADGSRAVPLAVLVFLLLDVLTTMVGHAYGISDLGRTGLLADAQRFVLVGAAACMMWKRPALAILLTAIVVALVFSVGSTGEEMWLVVISGVTAAIRAHWWQLGLVATAQLGFAVAFGWRVGQSYPGEAWAATQVTVLVAGAALAVGLVARRLLRTRDRRRSHVHQLELEQAEIRAVERARLADELQSVVTSGLAAIEVELDGVAREPADVHTLRSVLAQIDDHSRSLLIQLRVLLEVLRRDARPDPPRRSAVRGPWPRRWVEQLYSQHVRIAATVVFGVLAGQAAVGDLAQLPAADRVVSVIGLLAWAVAVWRPLWGVSLAVAALSVSLACRTDGDWDVVSITLVCLVAALRFGPRRFWLVVLGVSGYAGLLVVNPSTATADHVLSVCISTFPAIALGLTARHLLAAQDDSRRQLVQLTDERDQIESQERGAVARELHDVVAHSLSMTAMLVMATSLSNDRDRLANTVDQVRRSTQAARHELETLLHAMRGPDTGSAGPAPLITPLASASALAARLGEGGYEAVLDIDPAANHLDPTTQRTLSRIMQEGATNVLRYAPPHSVCHFTLLIDEADVRLSIVSPLTKSERLSDFTLGWGLRGIRERVELTHGTFTAGPRQGHWVLEVSLPAPPSGVPPVPVEERDPARALFGASTSPH